jgi:hypothetical protein
MYAYNAEYYSNIIKQANICQLSERSCICVQDKLNRSCLVVQSTYTVKKGKVHKSIFSI